MITRGGATTGADQATQTEPAAQAQPQVQPTVQKKASLDGQKKKRILMDVRLEFVEIEQPSTLG